MKGGSVIQFFVRTVVTLLAIESTTCFVLAQTQTQTQTQTTTVPLPERLKIAQQQVEANPTDAKKRFELAELLRLSGERKKAAVEYLDVTSIDPAYYLAYHQLIRSRPTDDQLDEGIERLKKLESEKPKNLMLKVALSELLERKGEYYAAARALIDLQYAHDIPAKYAARINTRIHYLLSKTKEVQTTQTAQNVQRQAEEELDSVPLPLPDVSGMSDGLSATKLKDGKVQEGYGHAHLLP